MTEWQLEKDVGKMGAERYVDEQVKKAKAKDKIKDNVRTAGKLRELLQEIAPNCPTEVVSAVAVDLADLATVASEHRLHVKQILELAEPITKSQIEDILAKVKGNLLFEAQFHLDSLKKNLPKMTRSITRQPRRKVTKKPKRRP